ncbi:phage tail protein [Bordetella avium]|uniref:phage tail protein n=1 Tax=Bordetella avium TaxID=521 RepID=UPI000E690E66|nr:phage tail protein [Bordetella avium]RIQ63487.1 phage tail protein [Bordetella avium]
MANEFFTILTATGRNKLANATATATPLSLTQMAVGDGDNGAYYSPTEAQTTLKHEVWRGAINHLAVDANNPNWIVAELVIPDDVGGFYIREVGLFDSAGALIAVGKFPESYKPTLAAGSNKQLYVRMILEVANTSAVTLLVDPSVVLATRQYCDDKVADELNKRDSKQSVRVATTAAIALAGLQTIDGVVLVAGDRVLVKDQAAGAENGIYVAAAGAWTRATDADSGTKLNAGALVPVEAGTVNADTIWMLKTDGAIIIGATPIAFQWAGGLNAPTQAAGDNSAKVANTAFVQAAIAALVASSPAALDTLNELAAALGNDANFAATITNALALKAPLASPALTGNPTAPTPAQFDNDTSLATTAFVQANGLRYGFSSVVANRNLALADIGNICWFSGGYTVTMPTPQSLGIPVGATVTFYNTAAVNAVVTAGAGASFDCLASPVTVKQGEFVTFVATSTTQWTQFGVSDLGKIGSFAASLALNGYQKLPSGLIIQWATNTQTGESISVSLPIAFPNACLFGAVNIRTDNGAAVVSARTTTSLQGSALVAGVNASGTHTYDWLAIGY